VVRLEAGICEPTWRTALALADALEAEPLTLFPNREDPGHYSGVSAETSTAGQGRRDEP